MVVSFDKSFSPGAQLLTISILYWIFILFFLMIILYNFQNGDKSSEKALFFSVFGISILLFFIILILMLYLSVGIRNRTVITFFIILFFIIVFAGTIFLLYRYASIIWLIVYIILSILFFIIICYVLYHDVDRVILKHEKYEERKKITKEQRKKS